MSSFLPRMLPRIAFAGWETFFMRAGFAWLLWDRFPTLANLPPADSVLRFPNGLARWIDFSWALSPEVFGVYSLIVTAALVLYVTGFAFPIASTILFLGYLITGTLINSNGSISHYYQLMTLVLGFQALAAWLWASRHSLRETWLWPSGDLHSFTTRVTLQVLAGNYVLCGLTKLINSKGAWLGNTLNMPVQFTKIEANKFYNTLEVPDMGIGGWLNDLCIQHPWLCLIVYSPGLFVELLAFLLLFGRKWALVLGLFVVGMHVIIKATMGLNFDQHQWIFFLFAVNAPYWISRWIRWPKPVEFDGVTPARIAFAGWRPAVIFGWGVQWLRRAWIGAAFFWVSVLLGLIFKENFPVSNWPMYGNITSQTGYAYLVDAADQPIPVSLFRESSSRLDKQFNKEKSAESKRAKAAGLPENPAVTDRLAGIHLLERLAERLTPDQRAQFRELGLVEVDLMLDRERRVQKIERPIAKVPL